jgi:hypothetical protein
VVHVLRSFVRRYERLSKHRRDPGIYLDEAMGGVYTLVIKDFAPLSERLRSALERMREVPRVLEEARQNVRPLTCRRCGPRLRWSRSGRRPASSAARSSEGLQR